MNEFFFVYEIMCEFVKDFLTNFIHELFLVPLSSMPPVAVAHDLSNQSANE